MKSILQERKECYLTGRTYGLHEHHIFGGANRTKSEQYGLKVWLCPELHNMSENGVHNNAELMQAIRKAGQMAFERVHGSRADFVRIFGKNYLGEEL